jgi:hypothetical protein
MVIASFILFLAAGSGAGFPLRAARWTGAEETRGELGCVMGFTN